MYLGVPRVSCSRTMEDNTLARPVYEMDWPFLGSSHGVPMELGCRRWQAMATREPNSALHLMHLNPSACGAFELTAWLLWWAGPIMPVAIKLSAPGLSMYCGNTPFASEMMETKHRKWSCNRFAHQTRCISGILVRESHSIWNSARKPHCACQYLISCAMVT